MPNIKINPFCFPIKSSHDVRILDPEFESIEKAKHEHALRIKSLKRAGEAHHRELQERLQQCRKGRRCLNPACPVCFRCYRIWFVGEVLYILAELGPLSFVTLIPTTAAVEPNNLRNISPSKLINKLRQQLRRAGVAGPIVGALDGEYDSERGVYQPHFHLICPSDQVKTIKQMAKRHYPNCNEVYRGSQVDKVYDPIPVISYCSKGYWPKRIRCGVLKKRTTQRLNQVMHAAWLVWRGQFGLHDFQVLFGVRRRGGQLEMVGCNRNERQQLNSMNKNIHGDRAYGDSNTGDSIKIGTENIGTLQKVAAKASQRANRPNKRSAPRIVIDDLSWREREEILRRRTRNGRKLTRWQQRRLKV